MIILISINDIDFMHFLCIFVANHINNLPHDSPALCRLSNAELTICCICIKYDFYMNNVSQCYTISHPEFIGIYLVINQYRYILTSCLDLYENKIIYFYNYFQDRLNIGLCSYRSHSLDFIHHII